MLLMTGHNDGMLLADKWSCSRVKMKPVKAFGLNWDIKLEILTLVFIILSNELVASPLVTTEG